jgi:conjugative transfer region protein (TIGR03750 family)
MDYEDPNLLADRVDTEPPIFRGCSSSELVAMLIISVAVWLPLSVLIALLVGRPAFFLGILAIGVLGTMFIAAGAFHRVKRNRPDHYYLHAFQRFLHERKWRTAPFIWRSGRWDIGRG